MRYDRIGGLALIAAPLASLVMMAFHPTGAALRRDFASVAPINAAVHTLAIAVSVATFFGALALSRALPGREAAATAGIVAFAFGSVAVMFAAIASGFIAPALIEHAHGADEAAAAAYRPVHTFTFLLNQAWAKVYVVTSSVAIVFWSAAMLRSAGFSRALAVYGLVLGVVAAGVTLAGALRMDIHGFGAVVLGQTIWFVAAGVALVRGATWPAPPELPTSAERFP
jgi:hypothetical protein